MLNQFLAKGLRDVFLGGNWTTVNIKETIEDIDWQQANKKIDDLHSIAELLFHINYFIVAVLNVLRNEGLNAHDKFSFDQPAMQFEQDWKELIKVTLNNATSCAEEIENLDNTILEATFVDVKYGSYLRNISGIIEHTHYHLGQISLIKKILSNN